MDKHEPDSPMERFENLAKRLFATSKDEVCRPLLRNLSVILDEPPGTIRHRRYQRCAGRESRLGGTSVRVGSRIETRSREINFCCALVRRSTCIALALGCVLSMHSGTFASPVVLGIGSDRPADSSRLKVVAGRFVSYKITLRPYFGRLLILKDAKTHRSIEFYLAPHTTLNGVVFTCSGKSVAADPEPYGSFERRDGWCNKWPTEVGAGTMIAALYWDEKTSQPQSLTRPPHRTTDAIVSL